MQALLLDELRGEELSETPSSARPSMISVSADDLTDAGTPAASPLVVAATLPLPRDRIGGTAAILG